MSNEMMIKQIKLGDELDNSIKQIITALKDLQTTVKESSYYFITLQLFANGFERILKVSLCYGHLHKHGSFPTLKEVKAYGHGIDSLLNAFIYQYFVTTVPALQADLDFLNSNSEIQSIVSLLSEFGNYARYHNLNVVTGDMRAIDPQDLWHKLETDFVMGNPEYKKLLLDEPDYEHLDRIIIEHFVGLIERFTRAIVRQFTLGDLGPEPKRYVGFYSHFLSLMDDNIGCTDYYMKFFHKETTEAAEHKKNRNAYKDISKSQYQELWPFKNTDTVRVEKDGQGYIYLIINGYVYALNGLTAQHHNLPFAHEKGEAFVGRSVGPFIKMALEL
jgi:hypothetical protein